MFRFPQSGEILIFSRKISALYFTFTSARSPPETCLEIFQVFPLVLIISPAKKVRKLKNFSKGTPYLGKKSSQN
jgi:hypothetical protein